jgi:hypothetical protein
LTDRLSSKQQAFIKLMKESDDHERRGFELLLTRPDFETFFEALVIAGLFEPSRNPGPIPSEKPGYYRIPYWPPLSYLEAAARLAGERDDSDLANEVMRVIRSVSHWRDGDGQPRDNHTTWSVFAKMLGLLPTNAVSMTDIDMIPGWLTGKFDRMMVGHVLTTGTLRKFLASDDPDDWIKAARTLNHCTAVEFIGGKPGTDIITAEPRTVVDDYWLKEVINSTSTAFGKKVRKDAADVFLTRLKEVFTHALDGGDTWIFRPAVEDHPQNYDWRGPHNCFVEGLRDTVLAWLDSDAETAQPYIEGLLGSNSEIVERIAIHLVDKRFDSLRNLVSKALSPAFFDSGHRHELYLLLKAHFRKFTHEEKEETVNAIRGLPLPDAGEESERLRRIVQQNWLSAVAGQSYEPANTWLAELNVLSPEGVRPHPEFNSYHESHWGFGPSPHNVQDLVAFAESGTIVERLNAFVPSGAWGGPSKRSLSDAVIDAVGATPQTFVKQLPQFLSANPEYQYAIIAGFKKLWDAWDGKQPGLAWPDVWPDLIDFFESLLTKGDFWKGETAEELILSPTRHWISPIISEFLRAGTRSDEKAYAPELLPRTLTLVLILLGKSEAQKEPRTEDALTAAINTAKGKAVEALLDHSLRRCRLSDQAHGSHGDAWQELQPIFDAELAGCRNANFEFSALAGAYIGNLHYMCAAWVRDNFKRVFPTEYAANCLSALDGLAFSPPMQLIYQELVKSGVMDWALRQEAMGQHAREALLQRMGLAYLQNEEDLNGSRFAYLFETRRVGDLEDIGRYFWMIRGELLKEEQKERILSFWGRCVSWSRSIEPPPANLLSQLSLLSSYLTAIDERALGWLLAVTPHIPVNYHANQLIDQLVRLADVSPPETGKVLRVLLDGYRPAYDFKDRLKQLVERLAAHPSSRSDAFLCIDHLRYLPGMVRLYAQLSSANPAAGPQA